MVRLLRRPAPRGVRFCDNCVEVTTGEERARRRYDRVRVALVTWTGPR